MFSTNLIEEIKQKLIASGIKNTDFPTTDTVNKSDTIHLVQDGKDVQAPVSVLVDKVLQWNINGFLNVSQNGETYTLEEVINSVSADNRKPGQMVTFIDSSTNDWVIYQFKGKDVTDWNNIDLWDPVYDGIRFKGWFMEECLLTEKYPNPIVGDYAYVGTTMEDALLYTCITTGEWYNTGKKVNEGSGSATLHYDILFADLKAKADAGTLVPGCVYTVTDYYCTQYVYYGDLYLRDYNTAGSPSDWFISVIAVSNSKLSEDAVVTRNPLGSYTGNDILECKYSIDKTKWNWTRIVDDEYYKGTIYHLKDEFLNECDYDFKHLKIARFRITDVKENSTPSTSSLLGPYRCYGESGATRGDSRMWVGSGHSFEKTLIPAIFDGSFTSITGTYTPTTGLYNVSENYKYILHRPWYFWFSHLSWLPTTEGLASSMANGSSYPHLADIQTDGDVELVYTFCLTNYGDGISTEANVDASSMTLDDGSGNLRPYFYDNKVESSLLNKGEGELLPNIAILISNIGTDVRKYCTQNYIRGYNSTILIHKYGQVGIDIGFQRNSFGMGKKYGLNNSIICTPSFVNCNLDVFSRMYAVVHFSMVEGNHSTGVMFGYFSLCKFKLNNYNLLFGTFYYTLLDGETEWKTVGSVSGDGRYWYDTYVDHFFSANIMNAFQYSHFGPHIDANTVVDGYNKGIEIQGNFQVNYARGFHWDVKLDYACANGIEFSCVGRSHLGALCFQLSDESSGGNWYKINESYTIPSFHSVDIKTIGMPRAAFRTLYDNSTTYTDWKGTFGNGYTDRYLIVNGSTGYGSCRLINYKDL